MIGFLTKTSRERVQVGFGSYQGHDFLDLRIHFTRDEGQTYAPTPKGVTVKPAQIGELIELLRRAEAEAKASGLIGGAA